METLYYGITIQLLQCFVQLQNSDIQLLKHINVYRIAELDGLFRTITNSAAFIAYCLPVCLLIIGLFKNNAPLKGNALYMLASVLFAQIITGILKYTINRPRPFQTYSFIQKVAEASSPTFPSGHTTDAFAVAIALCLIYRKWSLIVPVYVWAFAVAYSRMDLGVHYPSDVIAAIIVSFFSALVLYHFYMKSIIIKSLH